MSTIVKALDDDFEAFERDGEEAHREQRKAFFYALAHLKRGLVIEAAASSLLRKEGDEQQLRRAIGLDAESDECDALYRAIGNKEREPAPMAWTTNTPMTIGWYWLRRKRGARTDIVFVQHGAAFSAWDEEVHSQPLRHFAGCEWYGPLTPPGGGT